MIDKQPYNTMTTAETHHRKNTVKHWNPGDPSKLELQNYVQIQRIQIPAFYQNSETPEKHFLTYTTGEPAPEDRRPETNTKKVTPQSFYI